MIITTLTYCPTASAAPSAATYSLFPITYSLNYAFSAKERDTETGLSYFGARYYSSDLSIWLAVDPMSGKYPSLSPYVYCANNPVKLVDPNGEEIWITEGDESYKYSNGKLYTQSGSEYIAKEGTFVYYALTSLNMIKAGGEVGNAMICELEQETAGTFTIIDASLNNKSTYKPLSETSTGATGEVNWNYKGNAVMTANGNTHVSPLAGLAHELSHAVDHKRHSLDQCSLDKFGNPTASEWKAVYTENQIRKEQNIIYRSYYSYNLSNPDFPKGEGPKMLDWKGNPMLPDNVKPLF